MNITVVDGDLPYPLTSGRRLRSLNLVLPLAKRHRITYIFRRQQAHEDARPAEVFLRSHSITPIVVDHPIPPKKGLGFYGRLAGNLLSPLPYSVTSHKSAVMAEAVARHAA